MTKHKRVLLYRLRGAVTSTLFLLTAAAAFASAQGCPNFGFTPAPSAENGQYPASVTAADLNNDGHADLATANFISDSVAVVLGAGDGTFTPAVSFPNPGSPFAIASGDVNHDGNIDLATANSATNDLTLWLGNGFGGFANGGNLGVGATPFAVYITDLNGDGDRDLASANFGSNTISVLLGSGSGGFGAAAHFAAGAGPMSIAFADIDLNGTIDAAVANNATHSFSVLSGNGNGTFAAPVPYAVGQFPQTIAAADLNNDGWPDIATANSGTNNVSILLNLGGSFGAPTSFASGNMTFGLGVADLNSDGSTDIVTTNFFANSASVLLGLGNGRFEPPLSFPLGSEPASVAIADLNGDGSLDLAASNTGSNNISILINDCTGSTNSAPTIEALALSRRKGAAAVRSPIAAVSDPEDPEADLSVTVNSGASATINGVTVSNLSVDAQGTVEADVVAVCGAADAAFILRVTDSGGLFTDATLSVTVTASNGPSLFLHPSASLFPHNGKMREVTMDQMLAGVSDDCDADLSSSVVIEQVSADEAPKKDKEVVIGVDCRSAQLRASRDNQGDGRVYSIRLQVTDSDGSIATADFKVTVPISPNSGPAIEGPPVFSLGGNCP